MNLLRPPAKTEYRPKKDPKNSPTIFSEDIDLKITINFPTMKSGEIATEVVVSAYYKKFVFDNNGLMLTSGLNYYLRVASGKDRKVLGFVEIPKTVDVSRSEFDKQLNQSVIFNSLLDLQSGKYIIDIFLRDVISGNKGISTYKFEIPQSPNSNK